MLDALYALGFTGSILLVIALIFLGVVSFSETARNYIQAESVPVVIPYVIATIVVIYALACLIFAPAILLYSIGILVLCMILFFVVRAVVTLVQILYIILRDNPQILGWLKQ